LIPVAFIFSRSSTSLVASRSSSSRSRLLVSALSAHSGYLLRLTRFARAASDDLAKLLADGGIETRRLRLPLAERDLASLPATEHARATGILLPVDESLTDSQRDRVMDEIFGYAIG
jgi:dTDP-4-amino-4,6-dideoxygalactose transaminase